MTCSHLPALEMGWSFCKNTGNCLQLWVPHGDVSHVKSYLSRESWWKAVPNQGSSRTGITRGTSPLCREQGACLASNYGQQLSFKSHVSAHKKQEEGERGTRGNHSLREESFQNQSIPSRWRQLLGSRRPRISLYGFSTTVLIWSFFFK